jgi:hypothetical protein
VPAQTTTSTPSAPSQQLADNPDLKAIFIADQRDRGNDPFAQQGDPQPVALPDAQVRKNDDDRDAKVKAMLHNGTVRTGTDFYRAALVYQHSGTPEGFLLAHVLATIAVAKGNQGGALWLSASSLDRYLITIGQKQLFGTQFHSLPKPGTPSTYEFVQDNIEPDVVSDVLRAQLCVAPLAAQTKGLPGPPQGTSLRPCPAADEMRAKSSATTH